MNELTKKLTTLSEEEVIKLYKNVFTTPEGQLVLEDLKNRCWFYNSTFHENTDETIFCEGLRASILHIQTQMNYERPPEEADDGTA